MGWRFTKNKGVFDHGLSQSTVELSCDLLIFHTWYRYPTMHVKLNNILQLSVVSLVIIIFSIDPVTSLIA